MFSLLHICHAPLVSVRLDNSVVVVSLTAIFIFFVVWCFLLALVYIRCIYIYCNVLLVLECQLPFALKLTFQKLYNEWHFHMIFLKVFLIIRICSGCAQICIFAYLDVSNLKFLPIMCRFVEAESRLWKPTKKYLMIFWNSQKNSLFLCSKYNSRQLYINSHLLEKLMRRISRLSNDEFSFALSIYLFLNNSLFFFLFVTKLFLI